MISVFAQSLKRLYQKEKVTLSKIEEFLKSKKITQEEYLYILGREGN